MLKIRNGSRVLDSPFTYRKKKRNHNFFLFYMYSCFLEEIDRLLLLLVKVTEDIFLLNILNQSDDNFWLPHVSECSVLMSPGL